MHVSSNSLCCRFFDEIQSWGSSRGLVIARNRHFFTFTRTTHSNVVFFFLYVFHHCTVCSPRRYSCETIVHVGESVSRDSWLVHFRRLPGRNVLRRRQRQVFPQKHDALASLARLWQLLHLVPGVGRCLVGRDSLLCEHQRSRASDCTTRRPRIVGALLKRNLRHCCRVWR